MEHLHQEDFKMKSTAYRKVVPSKALGVALLFAMTMPRMGLADAINVPECARQKSAFDGIQPLQYATVKGDSGARLPFHPEHPSLCASPDEGMCKEKAYVVPGDTVAVGNTCGTWSYAQYLGKENVIVGWVESTRLAPLPTEKSNEESTESALGKRYRFSLIKGRDNPVCEAYLQRLNTTVYDSPPYCGRPENESVPGFTHLNRIPLSVEEANKFIGPAFSFLDPNADQPAYVKKPESPWPPFSRGESVPIWRYAPLVDIDNDGVPDRVVIWQQSSSSWECGNTYATALSGARTDQIAFILTSIDLQIDEARTRRIFQHPSGGRENNDAEKKMPNTYHPLGRSVGIFKYRDAYYFDTFLGDNADSSADLPKLENTLVVYRNQNGKTEQMCEYTYSDIRKKASRVEK
jgi:hypothetical protein